MTTARVYTSWPPTGNSDDVRVISAYLGSVTVAQRSPKPLAGVRLPPGVPNSYFTHIKIISSI